MPVAAAPGGVRKNPSQNRRGHLNKISMLLMSQDAQKVLILLIAVGRILRGFFHTDCFGVVSSDSLEHVIEDLGQRALPGIRGSRDLDRALRNGAHQR
jgi:hypothetical protein